MSEPLTVYFSFRSPYSWLALHRLDRLGDRLGAELRLVPVHPLPDSGLRDPAANHARLRHLIEDVGRMAQAYGLRLELPASVDVRWELSHAAFTYAQEQERGLAFAVAASNARFARGRDLGDPGVLGEVAAIVGLDPASVVDAAEDPARHAQVEAGIAAAVHAGVFGVPFFVYENHHFWGNDRLEWVLREIDRSHGRPVPDLAGAACLAPAWLPD
ncbi:MAG: DsbA family protein [Deltaproteobacteria bacterium]|nr:DsbA family protein [Deltaproteobacteria bacterium]